MILKDKKTQVILENATHEGDTGSPEVQIAILTEVTLRQGEPVITNYIL